MIPPRPLSNLYTVFACSLDSFIFRLDLRYWVALNVPRPHSIPPFLYLTCTHTLWSPGGKVVVMWFPAYVEMWGSSACSQKGFFVSDRLCLFCLFTPLPIIFPRPNLSWHAGVLRHCRHPSSGRFRRKERKKERKTDRKKGTKKEKLQQPVYIFQQLHFSFFIACSVMKSLESMA